MTGSIREISPEADSTTGTYRLPSSPPPETAPRAVVVGKTEVRRSRSLPPTAAVGRRTAGSGSWARTVGAPPNRPASRVRCKLRRGQPRLIARRESCYRWHQFARRRCKFVKPETVARRQSLAEGSPRSRDGGRVMTRFNLSEWAVNNKVSHRLLDAALRHRRHRGLRAPWSSGGPRLLGADHGRSHVLAGRHRYDIL